MSKSSKRESAVAKSGLEKTPAGESLGSPAEGEVPEGEPDKAVLLKPSSF